MDLNKRYSKEFKQTVNAIAGRIITRFENDMDFQVYNSRILTINGELMETLSKDLNSRFRSLLKIPELSITEKEVEVLLSDTKQFTQEETITSTEKKSRAEDIITSGIRTASKFIIRFVIINRKLSQKRNLKLDILALCEEFSRMNIDDLVEFQEEWLTNRVHIDNSGEQVISNRFLEGLNTPDFDTGGCPALLKPELYETMIRIWEVIIYEKLRLDEIEPEVYSTDWEFVKGNFVIFDQFFITWSDYLTKI